MMQVKTKQAGFTLIEILIAVIIIAIGLLGIASLQASAVSATTSSGMRGEAAITVSNLSSYMRSNKVFWNETVPAAAGTPTITVSVSDSDVTLSGAITNSSTDCSAVICTSEELAVFDVINWAKYADGRLLNPQATITRKASSNDLLSITLEWKDNPSNSELNSITVLVSL